MLLGLIAPSRGHRPRLRPRPAQAAGRARIGAMLQVARIPETLRVREHIDLFRSYYPSPLPVGEVVRIAQLEGIEDRLFGQLSGGQKQRVLFGLALCGDPDLIFLDEPTVGMDIEARRALWQQVRALAAAARPFSSPRTTSKRPTRWPTASSCSTRDAWSARAHPRRSSPQSPAARSAAAPRLSRRLPARTPRRHRGRNERGSVTVTPSKPSASSARCCSVTPLSANSRSPAPPLKTPSSPSPPRIDPAFRHSHQPHHTTGDTPCPPHHALSRAAPHPLRSAHFPGCSASSPRRRSTSS